MDTLITIVMLALFACLIFGGIEIAWLEFWNGCKGAGMLSLVYGIFWAILAATNNVDNFLKFLSVFGWNLTGLQDLIWPVALVGFLLGMLILPFTAFDDFVK